MVEAGQIFKNYKSLCQYLGEKEYGGKSKMLQLERWEHSFSCHKEGHKIVIDEVHKDYIEEANGGNNQHVNVFMPYVIYCLMKTDIKNEYLGKQRFVKTEMGLVSAELYELYNNRDNKTSTLLEKNGIRNYSSFLVFMYNFEYLAMETMERCFDILQRNGGLSWKPAQVFIIGDNKSRPVYITGYEKILDHIETLVCNKMNPGEQIGRRYIHTIKKNKYRAKKFYTECGQMIMMDEQLSAAIRDSYKKLYGEEIGSYSSVEYYRLYYIDSVDREQIYKYKLDKQDSIQLKKALVNPGGPEMQTLKRKIYEDIFQRMIKKNKLGIPEKDFENLLFLIHRDKLSKKNYKAKIDKAQGQARDDADFSMFQ